MGVDVVAMKGAGVGLILLLGLSVVYSAVLNHMAERRGSAFFLPGFLIGVSGLIAWSVTVQYSSGGSAGVGGGAIARILSWALVPAIAGAWFACRSVLRRIRRGSTASLVRPAGGLWGGLGLAAMLQLVAHLYPRLNL